MSARKFRKTMQWAHIIAALVVGSYFYSPLSAQPWALPLMQFALIPLMAITGIALWQQKKLMAFLKISS